MSDHKTPESLVETPSGKGAGDENFPVGSFLIATEHRPHVATFYAFARAIDDIADNPALASIDKVARLEGFAAAIRGDDDDPAYGKAISMRESLYRTGITEHHCLDLIAAFIQDAQKNRYDDWTDLMGYCRLSAAPVGRYLLDLHGENPAAYPYSDALCNALQVINHLQDCKDDYVNLDRVYLPTENLKANGAYLKDLAASTATDGLRGTVTDLVEKTEGLLRDAMSLPAELSSRRLAMESGVILNVAWRLCHKLRHEDPIATRVELKKPQFVTAALLGGLDGLFRF